MKLVGGDFKAEENANIEVDYGFIDGGSRF